MMIIWEKNTEESDIRKKRKQIFLFLLVDAKIDSILMLFFIFTEHSTHHNLFQTREIRSLPGDNKTRDKKIKVLYLKKKMFYSFSLQEH